MRKDNQHPLACFHSCIVPTGDAVLAVSLLGLALCISPELRPRLLPRSELHPIHLRAEVVGRQVSVDQGVLDICVA